MIKIITYLKKDHEFSRYGGKDENDKKITILAEEEIDAYLQDGWEIVSSNAMPYVAGAFASTTTFIQLVVIFRK